MNKSYCKQITDMINRTLSSAETTARRRQLEDDAHAGNLGRKDDPYTDGDKGEYTNDSHRCSVGGRGCTIVGPVNLIKSSLITTGCECTIYPQREKATF